MINSKVKENMVEVCVDSKLREYKQTDLKKVIYDEKEKITLETKINELSAQISKLDNTISNLSTKISAINDFTTSSVNLLANETKLIVDNYTVLKLDVLKLTNKK